MRHLTLNCAGIADKAGLHDALSAVLSLPDYYGRNLDALFDCLTDLREDLCLTVEALPALQDRLGGYAEGLLQVLHDSSLRNPHLVILLAEPSPAERSLKK